MVDRDAKRARMQVRKDIGSRVIESPEPAPKGPTYLMPSACFGCRKSWKLHEDSHGICPDCGGKLASMGRNFSAPKRADESQWKKVELLWQAGFRFTGSTTHYDAAPLPTKLSEVEVFIRDHPDHPFRVAEPRQSP